MDVPCSLTKSSALGFFEVALHLFFDQVSCFFLFSPSLLKLLQQVSDDCSLNQFRFSFHTFLTAFVCSTYLSSLSERFPLRPSPRRLLSTFLEAEKTCHVSCELRLSSSPADCCHETTLCPAIFLASQSWHVKRLLSSFSLSKIFSSWDKSTRMKGIRGACSLSGERGRGF